MKRSADSSQFNQFHQDYTLGGMGNMPFNNAAASANHKRMRMGMGGTYVAPGFPQQQQFNMMGGGGGMGMNGMGMNGFQPGMDGGWGGPNMMAGGGGNMFGGQMGQLGMSPFAGSMDASGAFHFGNGAMMGMPGNGSGMGAGFNPMMNQFQNPMFSNMAAIGAAQQGHTIPNRTVYIGGVPPGTTYEDILNMVKFGPIESIKIVEDKNCCFIAFVEAAAASSFHTEFQGKRVLIGDNELKFGWGKPTICPQYIYNDVSNGASRNVYIGSIDETINEEILRAEFEPYGPIDQIRVLPEKHIAFVHLCSVAMAMKAVATLPTKPLFQGKRVNYGKDRCGNHLVGGNSGHTMQAGGGMMMGGGMGNMNMMSMASGMMGMGGGMMGGMGGAGGMTGGDANNVPIAPLRTLYLGGLHPDASSKDILDVVRGGLVQKLNLLPEKNTAFVTFVDPAAAHNLFTRGNDNGVVIKGKRVKVGWGKPAPTIPMFIFNGLQAGASRNVYVGPLTEGMDEERLRADFGVFGEIEYINILTEKNIAFVAFTDIGFAIRAVEGLKSQNAAYSACRVSYGKDRCNNPLRPPRQYADNVGAGAGVEDQQPTYYQ